MSTCYNIWPKNAIAMIEDENGFNYPRIDKKKNKKTVKITIKE